MIQTGGHFNPCKNTISTSGGAGGVGGGGAAPPMMIHIANRGAIKSLYNI